MMDLDKQLIRSLKIVPSPKITDCILGETENGTCLFSLSNILTLLHNYQTYETVEDMKSATLNAGDICYTMGYHKVNDGGGAMYVIIYDPTDVPDRGLSHELYTSSTLKAKMVVSDNRINVEQFGAFGDGIHDDSDFIQNAVNTGFCIEFSSGKTYKLNKTITIKKSNQTLNFNNCDLIPYNCYGVTIKSINDNPPIDNISIRDIKVRCNNNGSGINLMGNVDNVSIDNYKIYSLQNKNSIAINGDTATGINLRNGTIIGKNYTGKAFIFKSSNAENMKRKIHIENVLIKDVEDVAMISYSDFNTSITIEDITIYNSEFSVDNLSSVFYINGPFHHINIRNIFATNVNTFFYTSSDASGSIVLDDVYIYNAREVYSLNSMVDGNRFVLKGDHVYTGDPSSKNYPLLAESHSNIYNKASLSIDKNLYSMTEDEVLGGKLYDYNNPENYNEESIKLPTSTELDIRGICNRNIDWCGDLVLKKINGIEGEIVKVRSSTGQEISSGGNIVLYPEDPSKSFKEALKVIPYTFKCIDGSWVRIN